MDSPFIQYVKRIFDSWTALRIADQQSSAGRDTKQRIQALVPFITQGLRKQTDPSEVAGWLEDYFFEKLNVHLEDESQDTVANLIVEAFTLHQAGKNKEILDLIAKIPAGCDLTQCAIQEADYDVEDDDISCEDDDDDEDDLDSPISDEDMEVE